MTNVTDLELAGLRGIAASDFQDTRDLNEMIGCRVWTFDCNPFDNARTFSGVVSSLVKKGLAGSQEDGEDSTLWLTAEGVAVLKERGVE